MFESTLLSPRAAITGSERNGLLTWRLRRVIEHIERNVSHPISLLDLANVAGLSKMHFAAQFRLAAGVRPHEFVLQRRVRRSQEMLVYSDVPLVQIALSHGFKTQSHYSVVFKRMLGETPGRWRAHYKSWLSDMGKTGKTSNPSCCVAS